MRRVLLPVFAFLSISSSVFSANIDGFWKSLNDKTKKPESVIAIYEYQGKRFGRIVATYDTDGKFDDTMYNPKDRAPGIEGNPHYSGLDLIWNLVEKDGKYRGKIVDPEKGKVYDAVLWVKDGNLIVRGEVFIFGKNQEWPPFRESEFGAAFAKPDVKSFIPVIPEVVHSLLRKKK